MKNIWSSFIISGIIRLSAVSVLLSALLIVLLFAPIATAAGNVSITRTFQPSSTSDTTIIDSEIAAGSQTDNRGTDTIMSTRYPGDGDLRSLVQFDISSLPTGSSDVSGTLTLRCTAATSQLKSRDIGDYRVTANWVEGNGGTTGVTWLSREKSGSLPNWTTAGGDFNGTATATTTVTTSPANYTWDVSTDLALFLAASPTSNYGWILRDDGANDSNTLKTFGTKNNATASNRPQLSVTFTVPWDSYENSERTVIRDIFSSSYTTAYMKATGFLAGNYNVSYYDGNGAITRSENNITVAGDGVLQSSILFSDYPSSTPGIWYVLVQPASGYFSLPSTYSTAVAAPDTYGLLANDSFEVSGTAIPEFPTVMAGIVVAGACFGIYWWMRRKAKIGMQTAN